MGALRLLTILSFFRTRVDLKLLLFHPNFFLLLTTSTSHVFCPTYSHCFHIQYYLNFVYSDFLFIFTNSKVFFFIGFSSYIFGILCMYFIRIQFLNSFSVRKSNNKQSTNLYIHSLTPYAPFFMSHTHLNQAQKCKLLPFSL